MNGPSVLTQRCPQENKEDKANTRFRCDGGDFAVTGEISLCDERDFAVIMGLFTVENETSGQPQQPFAQSVWTRRNSRCHYDRACARPNSTRSETSVMSTAGYVSDVGYLSSSDTHVSDNNTTARDFCCVFNSSRRQSRNLFRGVLVGHQGEMSAPHDQTGARKKSAVVAVDVTELDCRKTKENRLRTITETRISLKIDENNVWSCCTKNYPRKPTTASIHLKGSFDNARRKEEPETCRRRTISRELSGKRCFKESQRVKFSSLCRSEFPGSRRKIKIPCRSQSDISSLLSYTNKNESHYTNVTDIATGNRNTRPQSQRFATTAGAFGQEMSAQGEKRVVKGKAVHITPSHSMAARKTGQRNTPTFVEVNREPSGATKPVINVLHTQCNKWFSQQKSKNPATTALVKKAALNCIAYKPSANEVPQTPEFRIPESSRPVQKTSAVASRPENSEASAHGGISLLPSDDDAQQSNVLSGKRRGSTLTVNPAARPRKQPSSAQQKPSNGPSRERGNSSGRHFVGVSSESSSTSSNRVPIQKVKLVSDRRTSESAKNGPISGECNGAARRHSLLLQQRYLRTSEASTTSSGEIKTGETKVNAKTVGTRDAAPRVNRGDIKLDNVGASLLEKYATSLSSGKPLVRSEQRNIVVPSMLNKNSSILTNVTWLPVNNRSKWGSFQKEAGVIQEDSSSISSHSQPPADKSPISISEPKVTSDEVRAPQPSEASQDSLDNSSHLCTSSESSLNGNLINNLIACHRMVVKNETAHRPELKGKAQHESMIANTDQENKTCTAKTPTQEHAQNEYESKVQINKPNQDKGNVKHTEQRVERDGVSCHEDEPEPLSVKSSSNVKINTELNEIVKSVLNFLKDSQNDPQTNVPDEKCGVLSCKQSSRVFQTSNGIPLTEPKKAVLDTHCYPTPSPHQSQNFDTPNESSSTSEQSSLSLELGSGALQAKIIHALKLQSLAKSVPSKTVGSIEQEKRNTLERAEMEETNPGTGQIDPMSHIEGSTLLAQQSPNVATCVVNTLGFRINELNAESAPENDANVSTECAIQSQIHRNTACEVRISEDQDVLKQNHTVDNTNCLGVDKLACGSGVRQRTDLYKNEANQRAYETKDSLNAVELPQIMTSFTSPTTASVKLMNFTENQRSDTLISEKSAKQTQQTRSQLQDFNSFESENIFPEEQQIGNFTAQFKRLKDVKRRLLRQKSDVFVTGSDTSIVTCSQTSQAAPVSRYAPGRLAINPGHNELDIKREKEKISCRCAAIHSILTDLKHHILLERISQYKYGSADQFMADQVLSEDGRLTNEAIESHQSSTIERVSSERHRSPFEKCSTVEPSLYPFSRCIASDSKSSLDGFEPSASEVSESMKLIASVIKKNALSPHEVLRALGFQDGQLASPRENHKARRKGSDRNVFIEDYCRQLIANWQRSQYKDSSILPAELEWSPIVDDESDTIRKRLAVASLEIPSPQMIGMGPISAAESSPPYVFYKPKPCRPQASSHSPLRDDDLPTTQLSGKEKRTAIVDSSRPKKTIRNDASVEHNVERSAKMKVSREDRSEKNSEMSESKRVKSLLDKFQTMTTKELLDFAMCHRGDDTLNRLIVREVYERASKKQAGNRNKSQLRQGAMQLFFLLSNRSITSKSESLESLLCPERKSSASPHAGQYKMATDFHSDAANSEIRKQETKRTATDQYSIMKAEFKERVKENQRIINQWSFSSIGKYKSGGDISQGDETSLKAKIASASKAVMKQISPKIKDTAIAVNVEYCKDKAADVKKHPLKKYTFSSTSPKSVEQARDRESVFKTIMSGDDHRRALKSECSAPSKKTHGYVSKFTSPIIKMSDTKCTVTDGVAVCYLKTSASSRGKEVRVRDSKVRTISWKDDACVVDDVRTETSTGGVEGQGSVHRYHPRPSRYVSTTAEMFANQPSKRPSKYNFAEMQRFRDKELAAGAGSSAPGHIGVSHEGVLRHGAVLQTIQEHETCDAETLTTPSSVNVLTEVIGEERSSVSEMNDIEIKEGVKRFVDASANTEEIPDSGLCRGDRGSLNDVRPKLDRVSTASLTDMDTGDCKPTCENEKETAVPKNVSSYPVEKQTQFDKCEQFTDVDIITDPNKHNPVQETLLPLDEVIETKQTKEVGTETKVQSTNDDDILCTRDATKRTQTASADPEKKIAEGLLRRKAVKDETFHTGGHVVVCGLGASVEDEESSTCHTGVDDPVVRLFSGGVQSNESEVGESHPEKVNVSNDSTEDSASVTTVSNSSSMSRKIEFESALCKGSANITPEKSSCDSMANIQEDGCTMMANILDSTDEERADDHRKQDDSCEKNQYLDSDSGTDKVADKESANENPLIALDGVENNKEDGRLRGSAAEVVSSQQDDMARSLPECHPTYDISEDAKYNADDIDHRTFVVDVDKRADAAREEDAINDLAVNEKASQNQQDAQAAATPVTYDADAGEDESSESTLEADDIRCKPADISHSQALATKDGNNLKLPCSQRECLADARETVHIVPQFSSIKKSVSQLSSCEKSVLQLLNCEKSVSQLSFNESTTTPHFLSIENSVSPHETSKPQTEQIESATKTNVDPRDEKPIENGLSPRAGEKITLSSPIDTISPGNQENGGIICPCENVIPGDEFTMDGLCAGEERNIARTNQKCPRHEPHYVTLCNCLSPYNDETREIENGTSPRKDLKKTLSSSPSSQNYEDSNRQPEMEKPCLRIDKNIVNISRREEAGVFSNLIGDSVTNRKDADTVKTINENSVSLQRGADAVKTINEDSVSLQRGADAVKTINEDSVSLQRGADAVKTINEDSVSLQRGADAVKTIIHDSVIFRKERDTEKSLLDDSITHGLEADTVNTFKDSSVSLRKDVDTMKTIINDNVILEKEADAVNTFIDDSVSFRKDANTVKTTKNDNVILEKEADTVNNIINNSVALRKDEDTGHLLKDDNATCRKEVTVSTYIEDSVNKINETRTLEKIDKDDIVIVKKVVDTVQTCIDNSVTCRIETDTANTHINKSVTIGKDADTVNTFIYDGAICRELDEIVNTLADDSVTQRKYADTVNNLIDDSLTPKKNPDTVNTLIDNTTACRKDADNVQIFKEDIITHRKDAYIMDTFKEDSISNSKGEHVGTTHIFGLHPRKDENISKTSSLNTLCPIKPGIFVSRHDKQTSAAASSGQNKYNSGDKTSTSKELDIRNYFRDVSDRSKAANVGSPFLMNGREIPRIVIENIDSDAMNEPSGNGEADLMCGSGNCGMSQNKLGQRGTSPNSTNPNSQIRNSTNLNSQIQNSTIQHYASSKLQAYFGEDSDDASFPEVFSARCDIISEEVLHRSIGPKYPDHKVAANVQRPCELLPGLRPSTNKCSSFCAPIGLNNTKPGRASSVNSLYSIVKNNSKKYDSQYPPSLDQSHTNYRNTTNRNSNPSSSRFRVHRVETNPWETQIELAEPVQKISPVQNMMQCVESTPRETQIEITEPVQKISPVQNMMQCVESTTWETQIEITEPVENISPVQNIMQCVESTPWETQIEITEPAQKISPVQNMIEYVESTPWETQIEITDPEQNISPVQNTMQYESIPWETLVELAEPVLKITPVPNVIKSSSERVYAEKAMHETGNYNLAQASVKSEAVQETVIVIDDLDAGDKSNIVAQQGHQVELYVPLPQEQSNVSYGHVFDQTPSTINFKKSQFSHTDLFVPHCVRQDDRYGPDVPGTSSRQPSTHPHHVNPMAQSYFVPIPPDTSPSCHSDSELWVQEASMLNPAEFNYPNCQAQATDKHPHGGQNEDSFEISIDMSPDDNSRQASELLTTKDRISVHNMSPEWRSRYEEAEGRPRHWDSNSVDRSKHIHYVSPLVQEVNDNNRSENLLLDASLTDQLNLYGHHVNRVPPTDIHGCLVNKSLRNSTQSCFTHEINPGLRQNHPAAANWQGNQGDARVLGRKDNTSSAASSQPVHVLNFQEETHVADPVSFHVNTSNLKAARSSSPCDIQVDPVRATHVQGCRIISVDTAQHFDDDAPMRTSQRSATYANDSHVNSASTSDHSNSQTNQITGVKTADAPTYQPRNADPSQRDSAVIYDGLVCPSCYGDGQEIWPGLNNASVNMGNFSDPTTANFGQTYLSRTRGSRVTRTPSTTETNEYADKPDSCDTSQLINMHSSFSVIPTSPSSSIELSELLSKNGQAVSSAGTSSDLGSLVDTSNALSDLNTESDRTVVTASYVGHANMSDDLKIQAVSANDPASAVNRAYQTVEYASQGGRNLTAIIQLNPNDHISTRICTEDNSPYGLLMDNYGHGQSGLMVPINPGTSNVYIDHGGMSNALDTSSGANGSPVKPVSQLTSFGTPCRQLDHLDPTGNDERHVVSSDGSDCPVTNVDPPRTHDNRTAQMATHVEPMKPVSQAGLSLLNNVRADQVVKVSAEPTAVTSFPDPRAVTVSVHPTATKVTPVPTASTVSPDHGAVTTSSDLRAVTTIPDPRVVTVCGDARALKANGDPRVIIISPDPRAVTVGPDPSRVVHANPASTTIGQSCHVETRSTYLDCNDLIGPDKSPPANEMNQPIRNDERIGLLAHAWLANVHCEQTNQSDSLSSGQTAPPTVPRSATELDQSHATHMVLQCSVSADEASTNKDRSMFDTTEPIRTLCRQEELTVPSDLHVDLMSLPEQGIQPQMPPLVNKTDILPEQGLQLQMSQASTQPTILPVDGPQICTSPEEIRSNILPVQGLQMNASSTVMQSGILPEQLHLTPTVNQPQLNVASLPGQCLQHHPVNESEVHILPELDAKIQVPPSTNQPNVNLVSLNDQVPQMQASTLVNQPNSMGQADILDYVKQIFHTSQVAGEREPFNSSMCFVILPPGVGALGATSAVTALSQRVEQRCMLSSPACGNVDSTCPVSGEARKQVTGLTSDLVTAPSGEVKFGQSATMSPIVQNRETEQDRANECQSSKFAETDGASQSHSISNAEIEQNRIHECLSSAGKFASLFAKDKRVENTTVITRSTKQEHPRDLKSGSIRSPSQHDSYDIDTCKNRAGARGHSIFQNDSSGIEVKLKYRVQPGEKTDTSPPRTTDAISEGSQLSPNMTSHHELADSLAGKLNVHCRAIEDNSLSNLSAREMNTENEASSLVASLELPPVQEESALEVFESTASHISISISAGSTPEILGQNASQMSDKHSMPPQRTSPISGRARSRSPQQWKHVQDRVERKTLSFETVRTIGKTGISLTEQSREMKGGRFQCGEATSPEKRGTESSVSGIRGAHPSNHTMTPICGAAKASASPPESVSTGPLSSDARAFFMEMTQKRNNAKRGSEDFKIAEGTVRQKVEKLLSGGANVKEIVKQRSAPDPKTKETTVALKYAEQVKTDFEKAAAALSSPDSSPNSPTSQSPSKVADLKKIFLGSTSPRNYSSQNDGELNKTASFKEELKTQSEGPTCGAKGVFAAVADPKMNRVSITKPNSPQKTIALRPLPSGDALAVSGDQRQFKSPNRLNNCKGTAPGESEGQARFTKQKQNGSQAVASTKETVNMPVRQARQESQNSGINPNVSTPEPIPLKRKTRSVPVVCAPNCGDKPADRTAASQQVGSEICSPLRVKYPASRQDKISPSSVSKVRFTNKSDGAMDAATTNKERSSSVSRSPIKSKRPVEDDHLRSTALKKGGKEAEKDRSSWKSACSKNSDSSESDSGSLSSSPLLEVNRKLALIKCNGKAPSSASLADDDSEDGSFASFQSTPSGVGGKVPPRREDNVFVINNDYLFLSCSNTACLRGVSESSSDLTIKSTFPINGEDSSSADEIDSGAEASENGHGPVRRPDSTSFSDSFHSCTSAISHIE
ncbi:hypothetical protein Btru_053762 [Bulinus truncatus]|nr:hypothetical protein Btru_053762 [Bulinus truncatus]